MNKVYTVVYSILWPVFKVLLPSKVIGNTKMPEGGVLICGNHSSLTDPLYVLFSLGNKQQSRVMAKAELMKVPVLGFLLKKAGIFGIDRGKADVQAIKTSVTAASPALCSPGDWGGRSRDTGPRKLGCRSKK